MLDGGASQTEQLETHRDEVYALAVRERDWIRLHEDIVSVGKEIASLEAREVELLLEAEETRLDRRMGFPTIYAYIEAVLGHSHHVATERMRVAHELLELHGVRDRFRAGEMPWTSVRELTRVVTPQTEGVCLDAVAGKTSTEVQQLVRGKSKGDLPTTPVDPKKLKYRIILEDVSAEAFMMHQQAVTALADACDASISHDEIVRAYASAILAPPAPASGKRRTPRYQIGITICRDCKIAKRVGAGMEIALSREELEVARADAEHIGDLENDEPGQRATKGIPKRTQDKVVMRDKGCCIVPGCRSRRNLHFHHLVMQSLGGKHQVWNIAQLCGAHHKQLHLGIISITGRAPDELVFDLPLDRVRH